MGYMKKDHGGSVDHARDVFGIKFEAQLMLEATT